MRESIGKASITVLAIGTAFGLGVITGLASTVYVGTRVAMEVITELKNDSRRRSTRINYREEESI